MVLTREMAVEVRITGRHASFTDDVKQYVADKLENLSRFNRETRQIDVVLDEAHMRASVEVIAHMTRGAPVVVTAEHDDVLAAVDIAHDKLETVLRRLKEKVTDRRHGRAHNTPPAPAPMAFEPDSESGAVDALES
jgi:ribosomal subunit interface protein